MSNYRQVPEWWYAVLFAVNFVFACLSVELWPTHLPIWALVIGLLIGKWRCYLPLPAADVTISHGIYCPNR